MLGARWSELDVELRVWMIPAERMKAGVEHRAPLSLKAIDTLSPRWRTSMTADGLLFPGQGAKPLSNMAMLAVLKRMGRTDITAHGFRSVFRDWAAENGVAREIAKAALAHVVDNKVEAAYLRTTLFARRRKVMDDWASATER